MPTKRVSRLSVVWLACALAAAALAACVRAPRPAVVAATSIPLVGNYTLSGRIGRYPVSGSVAVDSTGGTVLWFSSASGTVGCSGQKVAAHGSRATPERKGNGAENRCRVAT